MSIPPEEHPFKYKSTTHVPYLYQEFVICLPTIIYTCLGLE